MNVSRRPSPFPGYLEAHAPSAEKHFAGGRREKEGSLQKKEKKRNHYTSSSQLWADQAHNPLVGDGQLGWAATAITCRLDT